MPLTPSDSYRKTRGIIRQDTRANQPAATDVLEGTIYDVTDEPVVERSNGSNWLPFGLSGGFNTQTYSSTGTQDDVDLNERRTYLRYTGSGDVVFTGFEVDGAAPQEGDEVIIENTTSNVVCVDHQNSGSTAVSRCICASDNGLFVGENGRLHGIYDATTDRWRFSTVSAGKWITVAHDSSDFTGSGSMTWTVDSADLVTFAFTQHNSTVTLTLLIIASTLGGVASSTPIIAVPNGYTPSVSSSHPFSYTNGGAANMGTATISGTSIYLFNAAQNNWTLETNLMYVRLTVVFEVD